MSKEYRINYQIKEKRINLVIPDEGMRRGISFDDSMEIASEIGMDLVEIAFSKEDNVPICKIMDYGKLKYKESKKKIPHKQIIKEMKISFKISDHDLETKNKKIFKFFDKKYIVKYTMELFGREKRSVDDAKLRFENNLEVFKEKAKWSPLKISNNRNKICLTTVISPL